MNNAPASNTAVVTVKNEEVLRIDLSQDEEYEVDGYVKKRYVASFKYRDVNYQLMGIIAKEEFDEILKNLVFL